MLATESTPRVRFAGLVIRGPAVDLIGVLGHPWARHVMLAGLEALLVESPSLELADDHAFARVLNLATNGGSLNGSRRWPDWRDLQVQTLDDLVNGISEIRIPFAQCALERLARSIRILRLAVDPDR